MLAEVGRAKDGMPPHIALIPGTTEAHRLAENPTSAGLAQGADNLSRINDAATRMQG